MLPGMLTDCRDRVAGCSGARPVCGPPAPARGTGARVRAWSRRISGGLGSVCDVPRGVRGARVRRHLARHRAVRGRRPVRASRPEPARVRPDRLGPARGADLRRHVPAGPDRRLAPRRMGGSPAAAPGADRHGSGPRRARHGHGDPRYADSGPARSAVRGAAARRPLHLRAVRAAADDPQRRPASPWSRLPAAFAG